MSETEEQRILRQIDQTRRLYDALNEELNLVRSRQFLTCPQCKKRTQVSKLRVANVNRRADDSLHDDVFYTHNHYAIYCPKCNDVFITRQGFDNRYIYSFVATRFYYRCFANRTKVYFDPRVHGWVLGERMKSMVNKSLGII